MKLIKGVTFEIMQGQCSKCNKIVDKANCKLSIIMGTLKINCPNCNTEMFRIETIEYIDNLELKL